MAKRSHGNGVQNVIYRMLGVIIAGLIVPVTNPAVPPSADVADPVPVPQVIHPVSRSIGPTLVHRVVPRFPRKAARAGVAEGTVFVQAVIDTNGPTHVLKVIQAEPVGLGFEEAALRAVAKWRYEPFISNGEVKTVVHIVKVEFHSAGGEA